MVGRRWLFGPFTPSSFIHAPAIRAGGGLLRRPHAKANGSRAQRREPADGEEPILIVGPDCEAGQRTPRLALGYMASGGRRKD